MLKSMLRDSKQAAKFLWDTAVHVNLARYRKHPPRPKKVVKKGSIAGHIARSLVATARVLGSPESPKKSP
jgi:hypothetical protein